jgi:hypothetical protein
MSERGTLFGIPAKDPFLMGFAALFSLFGLIFSVFWVCSCHGDLLVLEGVPGGGLRGRYEQEYLLRRTERTLPAGSVLSVEHSTERRSPSDSGGRRPGSASITPSSRVSVLVVRTTGEDIRFDCAEADDFARRAGLLSSAGTGSPLEARNPLSLVGILIGVPVAVIGALFARIARGRR